MVGSFSKTSDSNDRCRYTGDGDSQTLTKIKMDIRKISRLSAKSDPLTRY